MKNPTEQRADDLGADSVQRLVRRKHHWSKYAESQFGGNNLYDDVCLLLNGLATRCKRCKSPTKDDYLLDGLCPDCDGRAEQNAKREGIHYESPFV